MRISECLAFCFIMAVFISSGLGLFFPLKKVFDNSQALETQLTRDSFLYSGFCTLCENDSNFDTASISWQELCKEQWELDSISIVKNENEYQQTWCVDGKYYSVAFPKQVAKK